MSAEDREPADETVGDTFEIDIGEGEPLSKGDTVEHADYGPLTLTRITVSAFEKRADFDIVTSPDALSISFAATEIRELWGEEMAADPFELQASMEGDDGE